MCSTSTHGYASYSRRLFPDEEGTETSCQSINKSRFSSRRLFPDEEGTETFVVFLCALFGILCGRRLFPDEEGTETSRNSDVPRQPDSSQIVPR